MPIMRSDPHSSSYYKKMLAYWEAWRQHKYDEILGTRRVRVLTIAKTRERIINMIKASKLVDKRENGLRYFWFAREHTFSLDNPIKILAEIWQSGRDDKRMSMVG